MSDSCYQLPLFLQGSSPIAVYLRNDNNEHFMAPRRLPEDRSAEQPFQLPDACLWIYKAIPLQDEPKILGGF